MSLKDFFRPKWHHSDWRKRVAAVETISDTELLARLAEEDPVESVRVAAVNRINEILVLVAQENPDSKERVAAVNRINDRAVLTTLCRTGSHNDVRYAASKKLNAKDRIEIIWSSPRYDACFPALKEIVDPEALLHIACEHQDRTVREAAWSHLVCLWQKWEKSERQICMPEQVSRHLERVVRAAAASDKVDDVKWLSAYIDNAPVGEKRWLYAALLTTDAPWIWKPKLNSLSRVVAHDQEEARHRLICRAITMAGDYLAGDLLQAFATIQDARFSYAESDYTGVDSYGEGRAYHSTVNAHVDFSCVRKIARMLQEGAGTPADIIVVAKEEACRNLKSAAVSRLATEPTLGLREREDLLQVAAIELALERSYSPEARAILEAMFVEIASAIGTNADGVRSLAKARLDDQATLLQVAIVATPYLAVGAVENIFDTAALDTIWDMNKDSWVRDAVAKRKKQLSTP